MLAFSIETTEKRGFWLHVASAECTRLHIDTMKVKEFKINNIVFMFEFNSDLKITGLMRIW